MFERVAIVGLGLVGGSIASALRRQGCHVLGIDRDRSAVGVASDRGLIDRGSTALEELPPNIQAVILAVPVLSILQLLEKVDALAPPGALLIDTGSVKAPVVEVMVRLPGARRAVGGHPIAGKAESGAGAADPALFRRRPFVIVPSDQTDSAAMDAARLLIGLLDAIPEVMDAATHDRVLARTSHLPQMVASALALSLDPGDERVAGPGLQDMTRLAGSDVKVWRDIFLANRQNVLAAADVFIGQLEHLVRVVGDGEAERIESAMEQGRTASALLREVGS
jgi:prephenate dehydrogenase